MFLMPMTETRSFLLLIGILMLSLPEIIKAWGGEFQSVTTSGCNRACADIAQLLPDSTLRGGDARSKMWSTFQANVRPKCRVKPRSAEDVATVLKIIVSNSCLFAVLGGGTSPFRGASNAEGGVTIDLGRLNSIRILGNNTSAVEVGGGVLWNSLYRFLDKRNLSSVGTRNSLTGVVGSILGGGISFFSQRHGWSCDNVVSFEVVLSNSSIVQASDHINPDLFWALRGGGNNFGIVTKAVLDIFPQSWSWYTFQRWDMRGLESVMYRLEQLTRDMPKNIQMVATTLAWANHLQSFVISERLVALSPPDLPKTLPIRNSASHPSIDVLEEYIYTKTTLEMAQKMDMMNNPGFFNFFGSITVRSQADINMKIASIFFDEVENIKNALGIQVYIVYNPLTVQTMELMEKRGGNALGLNLTDGPLTIVNINIHWSLDIDTLRMQTFMRNMIARIEEKAKLDGVYHPYIFLNHCFEEQDPIASYGELNIERLHDISDAVDPYKIFQVLQPGHHKLGKRKGLKQEP